MAGRQSWFVKDLIVAANHDAYNRHWVEHRLHLDGPEGPVELRWFGRALLAPQPGTIMEVRTDASEEDEGRLDVRRGRVLVEGES